MPSFFQIIYALRASVRRRPSDHEVLEKFERQFRSGHWTFLGDVAELGRFSIIAGYCDYFHPRTILDVACGQGVLAARIKGLPYEQYLGIDFSAEAIKQANEAHANERTAFAIADAKTYVPTSRFDLIVFNECFYYFTDPRAVMRNFVPWLAPGGHIVVSMFRRLRTRAIWPGLEAGMDVEDSVTVTKRGQASWTVKVLTPRACD